MSHAKTSFSTEICAGAIASVVQDLAPLRYVDYQNLTELHCTDVLLKHSWCADLAESEGLQSAAQLIIWQL
jgi:hypothetical protein